MRKYALLLFVFTAHVLQACTDFMLKDNSDHFVNGRSMEFGTDLESKFVYFPKGKQWQSIIEGTKKGFVWTDKYSFIGINVLNTPIICDGMNETGLSAGILWFPQAEYPKLDINDLDVTIAFEDLMSWILGSFATVEEVETAFKKIKIWAHPLKAFNGVPPTHLSIHDRKGNSIVIEFIKGKIEIWKNVVGVLTNAPEFNWQITNLRNYISLSSVDKGSIKLDGTILDPTGKGNGLYGIPGDWTPPSRFVKMAIVKDFVIKADNETDNVNLAFHLLNMVDIPYGGIKDETGKSFDHTQWVIVKDLHNLEFHYRSYHDLNIRKVSLTDYLHKTEVDIIQVK